MITLKQIAINPFNAAGSTTYSSSNSASGQSNDGTNVGFEAGAGANGGANFYSGVVNSSSSSYSNTFGSTNGTNIVGLSAYGFESATGCLTSYSHYAYGESYNFNSTTTNFSTTENTDYSTFAAPTHTSFYTTSTISYQDGPLTTIATDTRTITTGTNTGSNSIPTTTTVTQLDSYHTTTFPSTSDWISYTAARTTSSTFSDGDNLYFYRTLIIPETNLTCSDWLLVCIPGSNISEWIDNTWQSSDIFFLTDDTVTIDSVTGTSSLIGGGFSGTNEFTYTLFTTSTRTKSLITFGILTAVSTLYFEEFLPMESDTYDATYQTTAVNTSDSYITSTTDTQFTTSFSTSFIDRYIATTSATFGALDSMTYTRLGAGTTTMETRNLVTWQAEDGGISSTIFSSTIEWATGIGTNTQANEAAQASGTSSYSTHYTVSGITVDGAGGSAWNAGATDTGFVYLEAGWSSTWIFPNISTFESAFTGPLYMIQPNISDTAPIYAGISAENSMRYPGQFVTLNTFSTWTYSGSTTTTTTNFSAIFKNGLFLSACAGEATGGFPDNTFMGVRIPFQTIYPNINDNYSSFTDVDSHSWYIKWRLTTTTDSERSDQAVLSVTHQSTTDTAFTGSTISFTNLLSPMGSPASPIIIGGITRPHNFFSDIDLIVSTAWEFYWDIYTTIGGRPHAGHIQTAAIYGACNYTNTDGTGTTEFLPMDSLTLDTTGADISVLRQVSEFGFEVPTTTFFLGNQVAIVWSGQKNIQYGFAEIAILNS